MAALIGAFILFILAIPVLAIIAIVKASDAQKKLAEHETRLNILSQALAKNIRGEIPKPQPDLVKPVVMPKPVIVPEKATSTPIQVEPSPVPRPAPTSRPKKNLEEALGGKVAGLVGVMILVAGIAFLVGSPGITWPTPLFKILMGLAFGGMLLAAGYVASRTASGKFIQLSRTMTGGGGGLFYFCIFAAYSLYHLCGPLVTALGLTLSAALLLFLSLVYNSQVVATLGILGAFITPLLTGGDVDQGIFPLAYIALINLPVMFLGIKKNWQVLYNSAYAFTLFYFYYWLLNFNTDGWLIPLVASIVYFAEFMTLSLLIIQNRNRQEIAILNLIRMAASSLFLLINFYLIFEGTSRDAWLGACFACTTLLFAGLASLCWKWLSEFKAETLQLILWAILSGALLIFETTTGSLRALLWCAQALGIAWFFRKPAPREIQTSSIFLSILGGLALTLGLLNTRSASPVWFHTETLFLLGGALLASITCWILRHSTSNPSIKGGTQLLQIGSFIGILIAAAQEIFSFGSTDILPWIIATIAFAGATLFYRKRQPKFIEETLHFTLTALLCFAVYLHMQLTGLWISLAWTLLGAATAWLAPKTQSKEIQNSAILIGFAALLHATLQPIQMGANLILVNPHTLCGLFAAAGIGFQAARYNRIEQPGALRNRGRALWIICIGAVLAISTRNLFTALSPDLPLPWLLSSIVILFTGNSVNWMLKTDPVLQRFGHLLVAIIPLKILLLDVGVPWLALDITPSLTSVILWVQLGMLAEILWFACRIKIRSTALLSYYSLAPLIGLIALVSLAIGTSGIAWSWAIVSLWLGLSGLALTLFGFARKSKLHRHFALILFAATIGKVLFIDCRVFEAGARVMIFIGIGLLLLILSFIYQKVSARIL